MNAATLTDLANSMPSKKRINHAELVAPVSVLKSKGYTFKEIHQLIREKGIAVTPNLKTFASSMSQHLTRRKAQLAKA